MIPILTAPPLWTQDWLWSVPLTIITLSLHGAAIIGIGLLLGRVRRRLARRPRTHRQVAVYSVVTIGALGWILAALHAVQALIWAVAYRLLGMVHTMAEAVLFSVDSMTARGGSGLELAPHWRLMGALEATNGMLLFGVSTAFVATVIKGLWTILNEHLDRRSQS